jgi:hypothetical protein
MARTLQTRGISQFKSRLAGGGARPNLFEVNVTFPNGNGFKQNLQVDGGTFDNKVATDFTFLCKSAALPASNVAPIDVPFRGRIMKVAGDRTFDTWTITIINDENFSIRRSFESWMQNIAQYSDHSGLTSPTSYMGQATVFQLGRAVSSQQRVSDSNSQAPVLAQYRFVDIFPTNISQIDLSYDTSDTIEEFTVEFQVQYYFSQAVGTAN